MQLARVATSLFRMARILVRRTADHAEHLHAPTSIGQMGLPTARLHAVIAAFCHETCKDDRCPARAAGTRGDPLRGRADRRLFRHLQAGMSGPALHTPTTLALRDARRAGDTNTRAAVPGPGSSCGAPAFFSVSAGSPVQCAERHCTIMLDFHIVCWTRPAKRIRRSSGPGVCRADRSHHSI